MNVLAFGVKRSSRSAKKVADLLLVIAVLLLVAPRLFSQAAVGTILGGVFDSTGGAIAGAKVTITDVGRGTTRVLTTDASGEFNAPELLSGTYSVRAEAKGFQALERTNVLLEVAQNVRVDLTLAPGEETQTITVTEEAPAIDTTSSTLGATVTSQSMVELPLLNRNFLNLIQLSAGVVDMPGGGAAGTIWSTNGRKEGADVVVIEGVNQFDLATPNVLINGDNKGGGNTELPLDSVQEFSTLQNPPAEYGWRDGSAINLGIKSGTNGLHGTAYAFGRDAAATDAAVFQSTNTPGFHESVGNLQLEQPGFTVGGPIIKNKLFFFVGAEFIRQSSFSTAPAYTFIDSALPGGSGSAGSCTANLKTTANANCAYSIIDACNDIGMSKVSPLSAQMAGLPLSAANVVTSCTPLPSSSTFENLFPSNAGTSNEIFPDNQTITPSNNGLAKIDYSLSDHHHFDAFVFISRQSTDAVGTLQPYWGTYGVGSTSEYAGAWTWTPNSSWVNDLRGGAAPNTGNTVPQDLGRLPGSAYPGGYSIDTGVNNPAFADMVCTEANGSSTSSTAIDLGQCGKTGARGPQFQLDFVDKVSHTFGNHSIKFGFEQVFVYFDDSSTSNTNGTIEFPNLEDFLQGTGPSTALDSIAVGNIYDNYREQWHAAFVEDTWRITRKVTLTPGLRYEYVGSPHSTNNFMGTFTPDLPGTGGVSQVGPGLATSTMIHPQKDNFQPRLGVAWDVAGNGKTVVRAGFGMITALTTILQVAPSSTSGGAPFGATLCDGSTAKGTTVAASCAGNNSLGLPNLVVDHFGQAINGGSTTSFTFTGPQVNWGTGYNCTTPGQTATCSQSTTIFPGVGNLLSNTTGAACTAAVPCGFSFPNPNLKLPESMQWNLDIERALTNLLTMDVAYVGVHGYNEVHSTDLNEAPVGTGWDLAPGQSVGPAGSAAATCAAAGLAALGSTYKTSCAEDTTAITAARPYNTEFPYFSYLEESVNGFRSNYDGVSVSLNARNYHGATFLASYTFSHALDDFTNGGQATPALANPADPQYQYGNADLDVRQRLRVAPNYKIPGIKTPGQMLEGWSVSAIWAYQTGFPWAPNDPTSDDWAGTGENSNNLPRPDNGVWQSWNYTGPKSAFSNTGFNPIPCYGQATSCTAFSAAPATILQACLGAAQAPYGSQQQQQLALAALFSAKGACYIQNGGILTPPAYGTLGDASRGMFTGNHYQNVDLSVEKLWHIKERYSVLFRAEAYNVFNHINPEQFSNGTGTQVNADPSSGGGVAGVAGFGFHTTAQGAGNGNRQFQFGLKLGF